jgi:hypothetical protein
MGQYLARIEQSTAEELTKAERQLADITGRVEWQATKTAADVVGIVDPSPTADAISLGMSVVEGDWVGFFLSGVSFVPWLGDAVAKPVKLARAAKTIQALEKQAAALAKAINHFKSQAIQIAQRKMAAAAERARRAKEAAERMAKEAKCASCSKSSNRFGTQLPTTGKWSGEKGNSRWTSADESVSMDFREGYPDFRTSNPPSLYPNGEVEIPMKGNNSDFTAARNAMREKLGDPRWPGGRSNAPDGYTWHHNEDGTTMQLVRSDLHSKLESGPAHVGGESIVSGKDNFKADSQF